ncbi:MAG: TonB-dependent receptor [Gemmatimonadales bacterium]
MKASSVGAFARRARWVALAAVALLVSAGSLHAQSTGKLEGRIRDQAGAPIAGAQVRIDGTAFGAVANSQGYWFLNNVPAGSVDLTSAFVGYKPVRVTGLRVLAGQTITQDFALEQAVVDIGVIEVIGAANVLVPRDEVTTKQRIDGEFAEKLPVDRIANVIALQPGVVVNNGGGINIRGGRDDEASTYIDGVPVTPGGRGNQSLGTTAGAIQVGVGGFEDASVTTGSSSAEFGNAQSGIIAIQTKGGSSQWSGNFGYENDGIGGLNHSLGFNRVQAGIGGPLMKNLTFFLSGNLEGQKSDNGGIDRQKFPIFLPAGKDTTVALITPSTSDPSLSDTTFSDVSRFAVYTGTCEEFKGAGSASTDTAGVRDIRNNYGFNCQGARIPLNARSTYALQGKVQFTYGTGSRIAISTLRNRSQNRNFAYGFTTNPQELTANQVSNNLVTMNWTQNLSKSSDRALALDLSASYQWDRAITGPLTRQSEQDSRDPFGGFLIKPLDFLFDFDNFNIAAIGGHFLRNDKFVSPYDLNNPGQYDATDEFRNNAYGVSGFNESGVPSGRLSLYKEDRAIGKGTLDWQVDRYNRVKIGGEYTKYFMNAYTSALSAQIFSDGYHEKPTRWNAFLEDRLDLGDVVVVGGLRYDWYKTGASRPYATDPTTGARFFFPAVSALRPNVTQAFLDSILVPDKSHSYLSPHIQVSFPVTERTNFRLSYAHQVQAPDFQLILGGINTDLSLTNTNQVYGTDLDFGKTITFEFGIRHSFNDNTVLDVSAYNRDKLSDAAGRLVSLPDPTNGFAPTSLRLVTNADFGNTRGFDVRFDRRIGELFNGSLAYTFQDAKNTGSDPFSYVNFGSRILNQLGGGNNPPPQGILPTNQNRPHTLAGQLALNFPNNWKQGSVAGSVLENAGIFAVFRLASGTPYTRCPVDVAEDDKIFSGTVCSRNIEGNFNGARLPSTKQFDIRFTKGFGLGGLDFTAYADVRNLFNFKNITTVFTQTNDVSNAKERDRRRRENVGDLINEAKVNGVFLADSTVDLTFGGALVDRRVGCASWRNLDTQPGVPSCVYLIRTEERYGNGDGLFTHSEQIRAFDAFYYFNRGIASFTGAPRRIRLGFEVNF